MKRSLILALLLLAITSCIYDDSISITDLNLEIANVINKTSIELKDGSYSNKSNEVYSVSNLKYIISNIVLIKANGEEYRYPIEKSYFLINEADKNSKKITLTDIEASEYTKIRFGLGVDQSNYPLNGVNNFIPTAKENEMIWSWSAGYIFLKFEGKYNSVDGVDKDFKLHIGSHGTTQDNYKEVTISLSKAVTLSEEKTATLTILADISKIFDSINTYSLTIKDEIQIDPINAPKIVENASTMFSVGNISN